MTMKHPLLCIALVLAGGAAQAQSAEKGKVAYIQNGCWQCHGFEGQGGTAGLPLAPGTKPLAYITAFVRNTRGAMPPYSEKVLTAADLADIHAYLLSRPPAPDPKTIPLLN
jgi:ubiquinol-cytochrome c reductase cytochrome c subunit